MSFSYDLGTPIGQVRLFINDRTDPPEFSDEEIDLYLTRTGGDAYAAAALVLDSWAGRLALVAQSVKLGDYSVDNSAAVREMRAVAEMFRTSIAQRPAFAINTKRWPLIYDVPEWLPW